MTPLGALRRGNLNQRVKEAAQAERSGFDSYWFAEHPLYGHDALIAAAAASAETRFIELGSVGLSVYARHPLAMARAALTLQEATGRRFTMGLGTPELSLARESEGLVQGDPQAYQSEYLAVLHGLLVDGETAFEGSYFKLRTRLLQEREMAPPILLMGHSEDALDAACRYGQGVILFMVDELGLRQAIVPRLRAAMSGIGRLLPRICVCLPVAVTNDPARYRPLIEEYLAPLGSAGVGQRWQAGAGGVTPADLAILGSREQVAARLDRLREAGVTDFLAIILPDQPGSSIRATDTWEFLAELNGRNG